MPFVSLKTNITIDDFTKIEIKQTFGELIKILPGKSEEWLMVEIDDRKDLFFKGSKESAAMIEVKMYGGANQNSLDNFTSKITDFISQKILIPSSRIYVSYFSTNDWGYNGSNF